MSYKIIGTMPKVLNIQNKKVKIGIPPKNIKMFFEKPFNASLYE